MSFVRFVQDLLADSQSHRVSFNCIRHSNKVGQEQTFASIIVSAVSPVPRVLQLDVIDPGRWRHISATGATLRQLLLSSLTLGDAKLERSLCVVPSLDSS